jgi:ribulose-phosphate 3-epimerase
MQPAVVINPATRVDLLIDILPMVHHVLVMSVNPGFGGQSFIPFSLDKIRRLCGLREELGLEYRIEVDGGVGLDTIAQVVEAGADLLVAGYAVFGDGHAEENARNLLHAARVAAGEPFSTSRKRVKKHANHSKLPENRRRPVATGKRNSLLRVKS